LKTFIKRTITAAIFALIILVTIFEGEISFGILFLAITVSALIEFYTLSEKSGYSSPQVILGIVTGITVYFSSYMNAGGHSEQDYFIFLIPLVLIIIITELFRKKERPIDNIAITLFGVIYISIPFALLNYFVYSTGNHLEYNPNILLGFIFLIWIYDSAAYIGGSIFGKHKLFERISPKKSWEGAIIGLIICCLSGFFMSKIFPQLNSIEWVVVSVITVIAGNIGDLIESLFKRKLGIKDSGNILPGHGGILDRFDSILLASPAVYLFLKLIN